MDFLMDVNSKQVGLSYVEGLAFHWSSDCNMACQYCFIKKDKKLMTCHNNEIRKALEDGSFIKIIKDTFSENRNQIRTLELWGAEPTLNGEYFANFAKEILDYFPRAEAFMFSTNALVGGEKIYNDFFVPLYEYAENNKRKLNFELQFSIDGPPEYNDKSRHPGATQSTVNSVKYIAEKAPVKTEYFSIEMNCKTTVDISYMRDMLEGGLEKYYWYYSFFDEFQHDVNNLIKNKTYITARCCASPTLVDPGTHTVEDGKILANWIDRLCELDKSRLKHHQDKPLFTQLLNGLIPFLNDKNIIANSLYSYSCSGTKNQVTIGFDGRLYGCNRLGKNAVYSIEEQRKNSINYSATSFESKNWEEWVKRFYGQYAFHTDILARKHFCDGLIVPLAKTGQIQKKYLTDVDEQLMLFVFTTSISCHVGIDEDLTHNVFVLPSSYLKLLGNGAIDSFLRYIKIEINRGVKL